MITLTEKEVQDMLKVVGKLPAESVAGLYIFLANKLLEAQKQIQANG